jgi:hypothetical protein
MTPYNTNVVALPAGQFLAGKGANSTSQFGEDGLIAECLDRFGAENQWCFEVGAHDGLFYANTHRLRCLGWNAVLIESDPELFARLTEQRSEKVQCVNERIGPGSLDTILSACGAPTDLDIGIIDIDGQDYWAWNGMCRFSPRLMLVEFEYGSDNGPDFVPELGGVGQASYKAIERLGISMDYTPLAKTTVNLLFVKTELL